jgi:hypothetical protein
VVDFACATECVGGYFGQSDVLDFAFAKRFELSVAYWQECEGGVLFQFDHGFDRFLDRCFLVDSVAEACQSKGIEIIWNWNSPIVQVDTVNPKLLQRLCTRLLAVLSRRINHPLLKLSSDDLVPKLGSQEDLIPLSGPRKPFTEEIFRVAVDVCA